MNCSVTINFLKNKIKTISFIICFFCLSNYSQVGIGTTVPSATLDVYSLNDGFLIPRVALSSSTSPLPLSTPVVSELVYNTSLLSDLEPGFYYWGGTKWIRLLSDISKYWSTTGNSSTNPGVEYLGTNDSKDFVIKTNNIESLRITANNKVGIGTATPSRTLEINSTAIATPPIRLTQQTANVSATSVAGDNTKLIAVDNNGDLVTKVNEKRYTPSRCSCWGPSPYVLPADFTTFELYDGDWSGNSTTNTTLPDFYLPTVSSAIAAGHKIGDSVIIHRGSAWNVVVGTNNTNLSSVLLIPPFTSIGFVLGIDKWYRIF